MTSPEIDELFAETLIGHYDDELPWKAVSALRRIGTREVFDKAAAWCKSANPMERARGASVIAQLGKTAEHPTNNFPEESYLAVSQMLQHEDETQPLCSAIYALGHLDNPAAVPLIVFYQQHPQAEVRLAVACALGSFANDPEAIHALMILTSDADDDVRDWAVFGLGNLGDADSAEIRDAILARLNDPNENVREEAIVGLATRKDKRVLPALIAALNQPGLDGPGITMLIIEAANAMLDMEDERKDWSGTDYIAALRERFSL
jgi:HEAT repeat protein